MERPDVDLRPNAQPYEHPRNDSRITTGVDVQQDYVVAILGFEMAGDFPPKVPGGASDYDSLLHAVQYQ